jgi:hypothetical protein
MEILREPLNRKSRHISEISAGIFSNHRDLAQTPALFYQPSQYNVKGFRHLDLNSSADLVNAAIQNPTPFGIIIKQSSYLNPTTGAGQFAAKVPRTPSYSQIVENQNWVAESTGLPNDFPKIPTQVRTAIPKTGGVKQLPREYVYSKIFQPSSKGEFYSGRRIENALQSTNRCDQLLKVSKNVWVTKPLNHKDYAAPTEFGQTVADVMRGRQGKLQL